MAGLGAAQPALGQVVKVEGQEYVGINTSAGKLGMESKLAPDGKRVDWTKENARASFTVHQRQAVINGTRVWLNFPVAELGERRYLSRLDYERTLLPLFRPRAFALGRYCVEHVVLDPGHGGKDTGAQNKKLSLNEKSMTLDVARRMKQQLEALGYKVTLTRNEDRFVELRSRTRLANALGADLFVSLHFNAAAPSVKGVETYIYTSQGAPSSSRVKITTGDREYQPANRQDVANLWLGYEMQKSLVKNLKTPDRGVRRARFAMLEELRCPGVLVEAGYLSSPVEAARIASSLYRQQIATAMVEGIVNYQNRLIGMR